MKCLSLFSSSGIGELGISRHGIEIIAANELLGDRCDLYRENYPDTKVFEGDIWNLKEDIIRYCNNRLGDEELFMVYATPPCQGMSTNGAGKLKAEVAAGNRSEIDERNLLVIPALDVITKLRPVWVFFENVPGMKDTVIVVDNKPVKIIDYIQQRLGPEYSGVAQVVKCSDYGVPQLRRRLVTVFTRDEGGKKYIESNNAILTNEDEREPVTLWDAIGHLPPLDAKKGRNELKDFHPHHYVNCMTAEKYYWVSNTPPNETAYNNQCTNKKCLFRGNARHVDLVESGKCVSSKLTPIYCEKCNSLLPRPTTIDKKTKRRRLISGFHSAYRRMDAHKPARTLTRNFPFEASDNKIHPTQNRVLSIYEALILQTIADYDYKWSVSGKPASRSLIAVSIGESVPPRLIDLIVGKIVRIAKGQMKSDFTERLDLIFEDSPNKSYCLSPR